MLPPDLRRFERAGRVPGADLRGRGAAGLVWLPSGLGRPRRAAGSAGTTRCSAHHCRCQGRHGGTVRPNHLVASPFERAAVAPWVLFSHMMARSEGRVRQGMLTQAHRGGGSAGQSAAGYLGAKRLPGPGSNAPGIARCAGGNVPCRTPSYGSVPYRRQTVSEVFQSGHRKRRTQCPSPSSATPIQDSALGWRCAAMCGRK